MQSYDYTHRDGVVAISWEQFGELAAKLAEELDPAGIDLILGIARAGLFPATAVACSLRRELYPVRVTRRVNDEIKFDRPIWRVSVPSEVLNRRVAVIDEIADTGETLSMVADQVRALGAAHVITASLVSHTWARPRPGVTVMETDALVLFPWDRHVYVNDRWQTHPELEQALAMQKFGR